MNKESGVICGCYQKLTYSVVTYTELFFYKLGLAVGSKPVKTIAICWAVVVLSALGFLRFRQEKDPVHLWVSPSSNFARDTEWLMKTLEIGYRTQSIILTAPNVLVPEVLQQLSELHERIQKSKSAENVAWTDVCFKFPNIGSTMSSFLASDNDSNKDFGQTLGIDFFCSFVEDIPKMCYERSILELWNYDKEVIAALTVDDILERINNHEEMLIMGHLKSYVNLLSGVIKNETGYIMAASFVQNLWMSSVNFSSIDMDKTGNAAGTADWGSEEAFEWELEFEKIAKNTSEHLPDNMSMNYMSARSFGDVTSKTMFQDIDKILFGGVIMVIYIQFVISKFNLLEARVLLGFAGLLSVGMSFVVGCGLCSLMGIPYGPVHTSLPFLLMGLGVDDMFVIMACWDDLTDEQKKLPIPETIGLILKHGGVSISITSITDVLAFLIGSSTILPSLQSYCLYAAVSVFLTFVFAITFFAACFALDQKRIQEQRNGLIPCIRHEHHKANACSQRQLSNKAFEYVFGKILYSIPAKVVIIASAIALAYVSTESCLQLEQKFDLHWFVPKSSQLHDYFDKRTEAYPTQGYDGAIYMGAVNYTHEFKNIVNIVEKLENSNHILTEIIEWARPFRNFVKQNFVTDIYTETLDDVRFNLFLSKFLFSPKNAKFQANFQFDKPLQCGLPASKIKMANIGFTFLKFHGKHEHLPAMHQTMNIAENSNFTTGDKFCTAWSLEFATWVTDEVIDIEVLRNLQLALLCVMACTVVLIVDLQICFWVFLCVLLSMVNVCGFMQKWGLTIDMVSCIGLELAIGLCVDYATHIGHTFLTITGTKEARALKTVSTIGSAVLYGGLSTLIGVFMLSLSEAYVFQAFFKIFLLVVLFGLFHGVILLPVILSWIGPNPYMTHQKIPQEILEIK